jgi:pre-mRNA-splicing factor SYF2
MVKTRKQELSAEESQNTEQPEQTETATNEAPTTSEPADEKKEGDAASKARDRQARFKALQARAVSRTSGFAIRLTFRSRY